MSEFKGTPGPWEAYDNDQYIRSEGRCVAKLDWVVRDDLDKANARLIAAAPDLLEALEYLVSLGGGDALDPARAAIAKALGR